MIEGGYDSKCAESAADKHKRRRTMALKSIGLVQKGNLQEGILNSVDKSTERFMIRNQKMSNKRRAHQTINMSREQKVQNDRRLRIKTALNLPPKSNLRSLA